MEAIGTHNIRIVPKVHALVRHASKYMRHTGAGARDAAKTFRGRLLNVLYIIALMCK